MKIKLEEKKAKLLSNQSHIFSFGHPRENTSMIILSLLKLRT
jgi:hypothetical protein